MEQFAFSPIVNVWFVVVVESWLISVWSGGAASNVDNLFQSLNNVSRAVGTLVNIMTDDDEATDGPSAPPTTAPRAGLSHGPRK